MLDIFLQIRKSNLEHISEKEKCEKLETQLLEERLKFCKKELSDLDHLIEIKDNHRNELALMMAKNDQKEKHHIKTSQLKRIKHLKNHVDKLTVTLANTNNKVQHYITIIRQLTSKCINKHKTYKSANKQLQRYIHKHNRQKDRIEALIETQNNYQVTYDEQKCQIKTLTETQTQLETNIEQMIYQSTENELENISMVSHLHDTINNYKDQQKQHQSQIKQLTEYIKRLEDESQLSHSATTITDHNTIDRTTEHMDVANDTSKIPTSELTTDNTPSTITCHTNMEQIIHQATENELDDSNSTSDTLHSKITTKRLKSTPSQKTGRQQPLLETDYVIATHGQLAMGNTYTDNTRGYSQHTPITDNSEHLSNAAATDRSTNFHAQKKKTKKKKKVNMYQKRRHTNEGSNIATFSQSAKGNDTTKQSISTRPNLPVTLDLEIVPYDHLATGNANGTIDPIFTFNNNHAIKDCNIDLSSHTTTDQRNHIIIPHGMLSTGNISIIHDVLDHNIIKNVEPEPVANTDSNIATYGQLAISNGNDDNTNHSAACFSREEYALNKHMEENTCNISIRNNPDSSITTCDNMPQQTILINSNDLSLQSSITTNQLHTSPIVCSPTEQCLSSPYSRPRQLSGDLKWDTTFDFTQCQGLSSTTYTTPLRIRHKSLGIYEDIFHTSKLNSIMFETPDESEQKSNVTHSVSPDKSSQIEISISPLNLKQGRVRYRSKPSTALDFNQTHHSIFKNYCTLVPVKIQGDDDPMNRTCWM